jgi:hypothetical protein
MSQVNVQWTDCSDRVRHAFRIDEKGRHERVSVCGETYHPEIHRIENPRQLGLPLVCPVCEAVEQRERSRVGIVYPPEITVAIRDEEFEQQQVEVAG